MVHAFLTTQAINDPALRAAISRLSRRDQADLDSAKYSLEKAHELFAHLQDHDGMAVCSANLGTLFATVGAYPEALEYYAGAIGEFIADGNVRMTGRCLTNIGIIHASMDTYVRMLDTLAQAIQLLHYEFLSPSLVMREDLVYVFHSLADTVDAMNAMSSAFASFER